MKSTTVTAILASFLTLACCCASLHQQQQAPDSFSDSFVIAQVTPLRNWNLYSTAQTNPEEVYAISVPHTVLGALLDNTSKYPFDPFYGMNLQQISEEEFDGPWVFSTTLELVDGTRQASPGAANRSYLLRFHGLNYRADLTIGGVEVLNASELVGAFRRFELDITTFVEASCSAVPLLLRHPYPRSSGEGSCVVPVNVTVYPPHHHPGHWRSNSTDLGINFQDWNPHPADLSMGLFAPVELVVLETTTTTSAPNMMMAVSEGEKVAEISPSRLASLGSALPPLVTMDGFTVKTYLPPSPEGGGGMVLFVNVSFVIRHYGAAPLVDQQFLVDLGFSNDMGQRITAVTSPANFSGRDSNSPDVWAADERRVYATWQENPQLILSGSNVSSLLWWPWQMGGQPLWTATVRDLASAAIVGTSSYGIRDVRTETNMGGSLQFYINNLPLQFRGGGWTSEMFLREKSEERLRAELSLIREMGLNGIRLEGMLETDLFYSLADEYGLVLLPGLPCCDGWQHWDRWPAENYVISVQSMRDQARRLAAHPSVIGYFEASDSLPPLDVEQSYLDALVQESWPNAVISSASQQVSPLSGNPGVKMVGPYSWEPPTYWLQDGNGLTDGNYGGAWGFLTEGGPGEAPMTFASWSRTVPEAHQWNQSTRGMDEWWSWHMGEPYGHFRNLTFFQPALEARYGVSKSAQEYLYKSQASNYEALRSYVESYSRNKHRNATGFVQWMLNNAWPSHLWHLYDYYLVAGGGFYGTKQACQPLHLMYSYNDGSIWLISSIFASMEGVVSVNVRLVDLTGSIRWSMNESIVAVPADASFPLPTLTVPLYGGGLFSSDEMYFVWISWAYDSPSNGNRILEDNWYWLSASTTQQDILDFPASNGFRTPCSSFVNFSALQTGLSQRSTVSYLTEVLSSSQIQVMLVTPPTNPSLVFLIHVRFVNSTSGLDIAPVVWSDNFVTMAPGSSKTIVGTALSDSLSLIANEVTIVVDSWNSVVSANY